MSIVYKNNFSLVYPIPVWNEYFKKGNKSFHQKPDGNRKLVYLRNSKQCVNY